MTTQPDTEQETLTEAEWAIIEPDISNIETEDDKPVDNIESEKQQRLLTEPLYSSWSGPGEDRPFFAAANVGVFYQTYAPPVVPDMLLSLDVQVSQDIHEKKHRAYFVWTFGKAPEVVIEIASNRKGGELDRKQQMYARVGCWYYVLFDPSGFLGEQKLQIFELHTGSYTAHGERWLSKISLGLTLWRGTYEGLEMEWLRWCYEDGTLVPTGAERAEQERERAEQERERAEQERERAVLAQDQADHERSRAERLAAQLRALGIDPEE